MNEVRLSINTLFVVNKAEPGMDGSCLFGEFSPHFVLTGSSTKISLMEWGIRIQGGFLWLWQDKYL